MNPSESLRRLEGPLRFASKDDFAHLHTIKDIEKFVRRWGESAFDEGSLPEPVIRNITNLFSGFDTFSEDKKMECIRQALRIIENPDRHTVIGPVWAISPENLPTSDAILNMLRILSLSAARLKGVGPSRLEKLKQIGCPTVGDILYRFPFRYEDRREKVAIQDLTPGMEAYIIGKLIRLTPKGFGKKAYLEGQISDGTGTITLKWFKGVSYFKRQLKVGTSYHIYGDIRRFGLLLEMHHPDMEAVSGTGSTERFGTLVPIYPEVVPIGQKPFLKLVRQAIKLAKPHLTDPLPVPIRQAYQFPSLEEGLKTLHGIELKDTASLEFKKARNRFLYETFFFFELFLAKKKLNRELQKGISCPSTPKELESVIRILPFTLTKAQRRSVQEIFQDITSERPMNRLLQGDVGSGKTVVSAITAALYLNHGYQVALMAPTEILAQQHYKTLTELPFIENKRIAMLIGSHSPSVKTSLHASIHSGEVRLVVGTHALIQKEVNFYNLGLVIIDEQHRFGVRQRLELVSKGPPPDVLMMTATPIPRTLAMTLYGDMDISIIDEKPPGRKTIRTKCVSGRLRETLYRNLRKEIGKGHQLYIIYPLIEESEKLDLKDATTNAEWLRKRIFPDFNVGLMHGRLSGQEKQALMSRFISGKIHVLVSTTVVEVGVDVPNATIMVIEHAERFGLSQLHQLRGRVGRGQAISHCYLVVHGNQSEEAKKRLAIMEETNDGFKIAEADLAIRGPGDLIGTRQSGSPLFMTRFLGWDSQLLKQARDDAFSLLRYTPETALSGVLAYLSEKAKGWEELAKV